MDSLVLDLTQLSGVVKQESKSAQALVKSELMSGIPFEEMLSSSMKKVNELQLESDDMVRRLAIGDVEDISEVVLASSRAEVALKMFMELRNKFVEAYQQLSRITA